MFKPGTVMYARAAKDMVRHNCEFCGADLTAHQAMSGGICDKPQCHDKMIERVGTELIERKRRENAEALDKMFTKMAPVVSVAAKAIDAEVDEIIRSKVPYQGEPTVPVPDERRAEFEKHLRWIVARAFTEEVKDLDLSYRDALDQDEPDVLASACTSCQGGCCQLGGNTGFLHDVDIDRWRTRNPAATPDEIIDYYLGKVPEASTKDACIYQGAQGCVLPRDMRNDQCNTFYCKSVRTLQEALMESETGKVVIIADDDGEARSVVGWSPQTGRVEVTAPVAAPAASEPQPIVFSSDDF